jgi:hypothetical protein
LPSNYVYRKIELRDSHDPEDDFFAFYNDAHDVGNVDAWVVLDALRENEVVEIARQSILAIFVYEKRHCERSLRSMAVSSHQEIAWSQLTFGEPSSQ